MVVPKKHVAKLYDLTEEERNELMRTVNYASKILEEKTDCKGMNVGMNIGQFAGGSIPEHIHVHIVPRRENDMGFIEVVPSDTINSRLYERNNMKQYFDGFFSKHIF